MSAAPSSELTRHFSASRDASEKVELVWDNIEFETIVKDEKNSSLKEKKYKNKKILRNLSGRACSGELIAILGPTGSGKTSLLNCLAARVPDGGSSMNMLKGSFYVNGAIRNEESFRGISAYVLQDDDLYAHMTVFETLMLSASFYLPLSMPESEKTNLVNKLIAELGLAKAASTIIGDEKTRGVSGGERKRTSIGVQLISDPAVLFLDEPTSGLDAFQSAAVMESVQSLARNNRLVITVIHQPRSSIYEMFDKLIILSEGQTMYSGPAADAVAYFSSHGHVTPDTFNPADYFLDILSPDTRTVEDEVATKNRIQHLGSQWLKKDVTDLKAEREKVIAAAKSSDMKQVKEVGGGETWDKVFINFRLLCWRTASEQWRNTKVFTFKMIMAIVFALIVGGIWYDIGLSQASIQDRVGVMFFVAINQTFNSTIAVFNTFPKEKVIVDRERDSNAYNSLSYYTAKWFMEMPLNLVPPFVFSCMVYFMVGLNNEPGRFGNFLFIIFLVNLAGISMGLAVGSYCTSVETATALGIPLNVIGILFGGFYINIDALPVVADWVPFFSIFRWALQAFCINEFKGLKFKCNAADASQCLLTGEDALEVLGFNDNTLKFPLFGLGMIVIGWAVAGFVILVINQRKYLQLGHKGKQYIKLEGVATDSNSNPSSNSRSTEANEAVAVVLTGGTN